MEWMQTVLGFLAPVIVAVLGVVQANWRRRDKEDAAKYREQRESEEQKRNRQLVVLCDGMRTVLRNELVEYHDRIVARGHATLAEKEYVSRTYESYHGLNGNGIGTNLHDEVMRVPTKEKG